MVNILLYPCIFCVALLMDLFVLCVACLSDSVCELFGETIRNIFGCGCYFVVECYGSVDCGCMCSVGYIVYGLLNNVCVVPVIPLYI